MVSKQTGELTSAYASSMLTPWQGQLAAVDTSLCGKQLLKLEAEGETKTQVAEHIQWASSSMMGGGMDTVGRLLFSVSLVDTC